MVTTGLPTRVLTAASIVVGSLVLTGPAFSEVYPQPTASQPTPPAANVLGRTVSAPDADATLSASPSNDALPVTGGDVAGLTGIGVSLVAGGLVVRRIGSRRAAAK